LICQVLWQQELILVLGGTMYSAALILMTYMSGLALGNTVAGNLLLRFKKEKKLYAVIQVFIGIYIFLFPFILTFTGEISRLFFPLSFSSNFLYIILKASITFLVLLIPSTLIGTCYPIMVSQFEKMKISKNIFIGKLNFLNSLGSVLGALLTGFLLIFLLGSRNSLKLAGSLFLVMGILVFILPERKKAKLELKKSPAFTPNNPSEKLEINISLNPKFLQKLLVILFFCSGFTALSYEILYNRILIYFVGNTIFSFTLIVAFFILGYSLGSFIFYKFLKHRTRLSWLLGIFAGLEILIALFHLFLPVLLKGFFNFLTTLKSTLINSGWDMLLTEFILRFFSSFILLIFPALLFGIIFPLVYRIYFGTLKKIPDAKTTGKIFGRINALNTLGSVLGPFLTGFILIALFQVSQTLRLIAIINIFIGFILLFYLVLNLPVNQKKNIIRTALGLVFCLIFFLVVPVQNQLGIQAAKHSPADKVLYYQEGIYGTVSVSVNKNNVRLLNINGVGEVPTDHDSMRAFRMLAYLPFMIHQNPRSLLSIAFGGGITFGSIANTEIPEMTCIEICKDVLGAAHLYHHENNRVDQNKKVKIIIQDGRNFIQNTTQKFDIITSDATHPASFDSWVLYTREFYRSCQRQLKKQGIMAQWIPLHGLSVSDYKTIIKTFSSVFHHVSLYLANSYSIILGSEKPINIKRGNFLKWTIQKKKIRTELKAINITSETDFDNWLLFNDGQLKEFAAGSPISTDDLSPLQFTELRSLRVKNTFLENLSEMYNFRSRKKLFNPVLDGYLKARILIEKNRINQAMSFIDQINREKKFPEIFELKKRVVKELAIKNMPRLLKQKNFELIFSTLKSYLELFPDDGYFLNILGLVYYSQKKYSLAKEMMIKSMNLSKYDFIVQRNAVIVFMNIKEYSLALEAVRNFLELDPNNREFQNLENTFKELIQK